MSTESNLRAYLSGALAPVLFGLVFLSTAGVAVADCTGPGAPSNTAWRDLKEEAKKRVALRVKMFSGQLFHVVTYADDPEAIHLTGTIFSVLNSAGWKQPSLPFSVLFALKTGVELHTSANAGATTKEAAVALSEALSKEGLTTRVETDTENAGPPPVNRIEIFIGKKP